MKNLNQQGLTSLRQLSRREMKNVTGGVMACQDWYDICVGTCPGDVYHADCQIDCNTQIANHTAPCSYPQS